MFDEIDANVGGRLGSVIGNKLRKLATHHQVLCITHLPQIAAAGTSHFHIEKSVRGSRTSTSVTRLEPDQRIGEIARLIGGEAAGAQARASAEELLAATGAKGEPRAKAKGETVAGRKRK